MRTLILLILLVMPVNSFADWSKNDTGRQATYLALHLIDWGQTRTIAKSDEYYEVNPIMGDNPSTTRVDTYMLTSAVLHTAIAYNLPPKWRKRFQYTTLGVKAGAVGYNYSVGIRMDW